MHMCFSVSSSVFSSLLLPILLPAGAQWKAFLERIKSAGFPTSTHYSPFQPFSAYQELTALFVPDRRISENLAGREVSLPQNPSLELVVEMVRDTLIYVT